MLRVSGGVRSSKKALVEDSENQESCIDERYECTEGKNARTSAENESVVDANVKTFRTLCVCGGGVLKALV